MRTAKYCLLDEELCRRSYLGPLLGCLGSESALKVMAKMHKGHIVETIKEKTQCRDELCYTTIIDQHLLRIQKNMRKGAINVKNLTNAPHLVE